MSNTPSLDRTLCTATYQAVQVAQSVIIRARGEHPTLGFQVVFEQPPIRIFPPQFVLRHKEPTGIIATQITPFTAEIKFEAADLIEQVIVHDSTGRHEVPVEHVPVVATRTRSGGFIATQETLTVYVDGTLHFVNNRLDINETQQVDGHQLRPLQRALAQPAWQTIKPVFGKPVADGFELSISGGGKSTTIHESPVQLPSIVQEVLQHLEALWPLGGGETELRPSGGGEKILPVQEPSHFEMTGPGLRVTYDVTSAGTLLRYQDTQRDQTLRDEQIETLQSRIGTLLTIPLRLIPDPLALTQIERVTFTVLLPQITPNGTNTRFETVAIQTSYHRGGSARQQYEVVPLQGTAQLAANNNLPTALFKHWVHAREEDIGDVEMYRPQGHPFPPAFGRMAFEITRTGQCIQHEFGPADEPLRIPGIWIAQGMRHLRVELRDGRAFTLNIVSVDDQRLAVRRVDVRHATEAALAAGASS